MPDQLRAELDRLTESARERLGEIPESGSHTRIFSYWVHPSCDDHACYTLYGQRHPGIHVDAILNTTIWRRTEDVEKLRDPVERLRHPSRLEPTIEESSVCLTHESVEEAIKRLENISLPSLRPAEAMMGLDGTAFRFEYQNGFQSLDISWRSDGPPLWQKTTEEIAGIVSKLLASSSSQPHSG